MKFCPNCGEQLAENAQFCKSCGNRIDANTTQPENYGTDSGNNISDEPAFAFSDTPSDSDLTFGGQPNGYQPQNNYPPQNTYPPQNNYAPQNTYPPQNGYNYGYQNPAQPTYVYGVPVQPVAPSPKTNMPGIVKALKTHGKSPVFIIAAALFTLTSLITLFSSFGSSNIAINEILSNLSDIPGLDDIADNLWNYNTSAYSIIGTIIGFIPTLLVIIGLWVTVGTAASREEKFSSGGLSTIKAVQIIYMIIIIIGLVAFSVLSIFSLAAAGSNRYTSDTVPYLLMGFLAGLAVFIFAIILTKKTINSINSVKKILMTGVPEDGISGFVGVIYIIVGIFNFIVGIVYLVMFKSFLSMFTSILSAASTILFCVTLFRFKGAMGQLVYKNK